MPIEQLEMNTKTITPAQLLDLTERHARYLYKRNRRRSPIATEFDVWAMLDVLNFTLWMCPAIGHTAVTLLESKYSIPESRKRYLADMRKEKAQEQRYARQNRIFKAKQAAA